ncbi:hypothetical protein AAE02nite_07540 [Adhaeribacter aerolatus]|uniref:Uncharacterized protein n=2 Tax=Adhaeribacter aerolatus TaxID=670289 RepID=A0A512ATU4_9BACT|nr:hypothetical protein AAE02nite_07540 [Adhaeribacter aerolatus]
MAKDEVPESSGLALAADKNLWTHGDSGNPPVLFKINETGTLLQTREIQRTHNQDWEDLAKDQAGNIYIGDFGNNQNNRRNLRIFRIQENDGSQVDTILFRYADQRGFPPPKEALTFDAEAFFYYQGYLYIFSKNRGPNKKVKLYKIPAQPGTYEATIADSIRINNMITAADISPDGKKVALLGYGNIYVLEVGPNGNFFAGKKYCLSFGKSGQAEGLVFINNTDFVFSNEGGKIFKAVKRNK